MELPRGIKIVSNSSIKSDEAFLVDQNGKALLKVANINCPIVEIYSKRKRRSHHNSLKRPKPSSQLGLVYNPNIKFKEIEKFWILSAISLCGGNLTAACKMLGMARETVYRRVREYNEKK